MKKRIMAFALAAVAVLLGGCSNGTADNSGTNPADTSTTSREQTQSSAESGGNAETPSNSGSGDTSTTSESTSDPTESEAEVIKAAVSPIKLTSDNVINSARLFDAMIESEDMENAMFSPLSLNMALGMLESGADGSTKAALQSYLQRENYADFAKGYMSHVSNDLNREHGGLFNKYSDVFEIANSLWLGNVFPISKDYKQTVSDAFGAEVQNVDFSKASKAAKTINKWTSDKTHKLIPEIVREEQLNADTAAVLVNTVYFESGWVDEWYINEDNKQTFTSIDGSTTEVALMRNGGDVYYENDKATAFGCYYRNGMQFIGILPKESGDFTLEGLDIPSLLASADSSAYDVAARMPKLNFSSEFPLTEALKAAGLEVMFDENAADFTKMQADESDRFYVSDVIQKTKLELDEYGTKAAAVTAAELTTNAMPEPKELREVTLDRPFAFLIYDAQNGQIAFMGKVTTVDG